MRAGAPSFRSIAFAAVGATLVVLIIQGCEKSSPLIADRGQPRTGGVAVAPIDSYASRSGAAPGQTAFTYPVVAGAPREQPRDHDLPPWLAELFHDPDPNVRIQALDAWARPPGASLDPVTYALVDSDESVRTRAQAVFEQELAKR